MEIKEKKAWPDRVIGNINEISDRAAMGLPEHYVAPRVTLSNQTLAPFYDQSNDLLVSTLRDKENSTEHRLGAGTMLSLKGDDRIKVYEPDMVEIESAKAQIGTVFESMDELYERFKKYGVQRSWVQKEGPRFEYELDAFRIARYPVTNQEYQAFLEDSEFDEIPTSWQFGYMNILDSNKPVYTVTDRAATAYTEWLSAKTGRKFRLPTEYEWEYAAAGEKGYEYPWGNDIQVDACNTMETGLLSTSPIGMFPQSDSPFGLCDMAGNVEEYVSTHYHAYPGGSIVEDDLYLKLGLYRIARGGAFNRFIDLARCQRRHGAYPKSLYAIGFRLAESIT
ncbi:serine/threonine protein kinase [Alteromonadaceae bacterium M269]|nr:serine/threonine protein kinase [Alteromonadaceae bacterium M269]